MKRILSLGATLLVCFCTIAQPKKDYRPLVDSLVSRQLYGTANIQESVQNLHKTYVDIEPINLEYGFFYNDKVIALKNDIIESIMTQVKNESDYQTLVKYYTKTEEINNVMSSQAFQRTFQRYLSTEIANTLVQFMNNLGRGSLTMKKYEILDKEFETAFYDYWNADEKENFEALFQTIFDALTQSAKNGNETMMRDFMSSFQDALPNYLCLTLMDFCTVEDLKDWQNNSRISDKEQTKKIMDYIQNFATDSKTYLKDILQTARNATPMQLAAHAQMSRSISKPNIKKIVRTATIPWKKGSYTGEIFNTLPHGKGTYTDKKGVRYTGDWMNGMRHGYITQFKTNGDTIRSLWAGDKVLKGKSKVQGGERGLFYKDKLFGPGVRYDSENVEKGMFIDGKLHGMGEQIVNNNIVFNGLFEHGTFISGTITIDDSKKKFIAEGEFDMQMNGVGTHKIVTPEETTIRTGTFINGNQDGFGERLTVKNQKDTVVYRGTYAYGEQMGRGYYYQTPTTRRARVEYEGLIHDFDYLDGNIHRITNNLSPNSWNYNYKGQYYNEKYHGNGVIIMIGNNDTITYEGEFKEGVFDGYGEYTSSVFTYKGEFENGRIHGKGVATNIFKQTLDGEWEVGKPKPHTSCHVTFDNGNKLEGVVVNGRIVGTLMNKNGRTIRHNHSMEYEFNYRYLTK